jgi:hypothetical protein
VVPVIPVLLALSKVKSLHPAFIVMLRIPFVQGFIKVVSQAQKISFPTLIFRSLSNDGGTASGESIPPASVKLQEGVESGIVILFNV